MKVAARPRIASFRSRGVHSLSQSNELLVLAIRLLATRAIRLRPDRVHAIIAASLLLKQRAPKSGVP